MIILKPVFLVILTMKYKNEQICPIEQVKADTYYNSSIREMETRRQEVQGQARLHSKTKPQKNPKTVNNFL